MILIVLFENSFRFYIVFFLDIYSFKFSYIFENSYVEFQAAFIAMGTIVSLCYTA